MIYAAPIFLAAIIYTGCYAFICIKLGTWLNCFTYAYVFSFAIDVVFSWLGLSVFGPAGSVYAFYFIYIANMASAITTMLVVVFCKPPKLKMLPAYRPFEIGKLPWVILAVAILLYLPVLLEFRDFLLTPREIYIRTRSTYGVYSLGSVFLTDLALILYLFKEQRSRIGAVMFFLISMAFLAEHGSKGSFIAPIVIALYYYAHKQQRRFSLKLAAASIFLLTIVVSAAFYFSGSASDPREVLEFMTAFADYNRNAMDSIDHPMPQYPFLGQIEFEQEVYSRIPRILFPNKPKVFGIFRLSEYYQPEEFASDSGAGSYGEVGNLYADFGPLTIIIVIAISGIQAYWIMGVLRRLKIAPTPGDFVLLCYLSGMSIIPIAGVFILPETLVIAYITNRIIRKKCSRLPVASAKNLQTSRRPANT